MKSKWNTIVLSGLAATAAMTTLMLVAPMMGMPPMRIGNMLAAFMNVPVSIGWTMHIIIGVVLAANYSFLFNRRLAENAVLDGMLFSLIPFLMAQLAVMPMMGMGVFSSHSDVALKLVMGSLMGHLVYGAVLGWVTARLAATPTGAASLASKQV